MEPMAYTATVADVMAHFGVSRNTVYSWLDSADAPPHRKPGGEYRFNLTELNEWARRFQPASDGKDAS